MQAWKAWKKLFNKKHLIEHYIEKIKPHPSIGLDKITPSRFLENLDVNIEIILIKSAKGTYRLPDINKYCSLKVQENHHVA